MSALAGMPTMNDPTKKEQPPIVGLDPYEEFKNLARATAQKDALDTAMAPTLAARNNATPVAMGMPTTGTIAQQQALTSALAPTMAAAGGMLKDERPMDVRNVKAPVPTSPAPGAAATPAAPTVTPQAAAAAPAPLAKPSPEQSVQLQSLISAQNNSRTPVSDPYAPVPGSQAAPAGGMPPPGGAGGADLNGTPSQQTAYWAQQKAGLEERGRYADQQAAQQNATAMMADDQNFKREMFEYIKANGEKLGPATLGALSQMSGQNVGANGPASAGLTGLASMANHMGTAAGDSAKNALTARGQDLTYAGQQLTGNNDMAKAKLTADTTLAGHANTKETEAARNASAERRSETLAAADRHRTDATQEVSLATLGAWKPSTDPTMSGYAVNTSGQKKKYVELGMPPPAKK